MHSNEAGKAENLRSPIRTVKRVSVAFLLVAVVGLVFAPVDVALARRVHTNDYAHQYNWEQYRPDNIEIPVELPDPVSPDFTFKDEGSGASLSHYPDASSNAETESEEFAAPAIDALIVIHGEECLHGEGSCEACDELRDMYRSGDIDGLYRVEIIPDIEDEAEYSLTVPLDEEVPKYAVYRCVGGNLETSYSPIRAGSKSDSGFVSVWFRG